MKIQKTLWYFIVLCLALHTPVLPATLNSKTKKHFIALMIGIGSKAILDHLIQGIVEPLVPPSDDPDQPLKREVAEELAKALSLNIIQKSAQSLLDTMTPDDAEILLTDFTTGMEFTSAKNLAFTSRDLSTKLRDPEDIIVPTSPLFLNQLAVYPPQGRTTALDCGPGNKHCTATYKVEDHDCFGDNDTAFFIQSIAPFAGAYFTKLSFEMGIVITRLIKQGLPSHKAPLFVTALLEGLTQAGLSTFLFEKAKLAFHNLVQSILANPERHEESIQKLMRWGEKYLIVTDSLAPHYRAFINTLRTSS